MDEQDYTRQNIRFLLEQRGLKISNLAKESGAGQSWVSRYMGGRFERNVAKIELMARYLGIPAHRLMYEDLSGANLALSQSVGTEEEIVEAAVKLERELAALAPTPPSPETYAQRLYIAMKVIQEEGAAGVLDGSSLMGAMRLYAAELRKTGG